MESCSFHKDQHYPLYRKQIQEKFVGFTKTKELHLGYMWENGQWRWCVTEWAEGKMVSYLARVKRSKPCEGVVNPLFLAFEPW